MEQIDIWDIECFGFIDVGNGEEEACTRPPTKLWMRHSSCIPFCEPCLEQWIRQLPKPA